MKQKIHNNKKYFALFYDRCEMLISQYSDTEIGEIIRGAIGYELYGEEATFNDRVLQVMYMALRTDIDIMTDKANDRSRKNSENAKGKNKDKSRNMTDAEMDAEIDSMFPRKKALAANANDRNER